MVSSLLATEPYKIICEIFCANISRIPQIKSRIISSLSIRVPPFFFKLNHYFLYDGKDLYFFIENVKLKYNNEEVTLSAFSYVIVKSGKYVAYYDKKNDVYKTIELSNNEVIVSNDYYTVNLASDMIDYQGTNVVLTSGIENLNTIDMKD